jgi:NADPH2:quinone reductase
MIAGMKALIPTETSGPLVAFAEIDEPQPLRDQALVAVEAFSINRGETFQLESPTAGWRPGKDVAGTVVRAADDGSGPVVGTRVVAHPPAAGWAERVAVSSLSIAALSDEVSFEEAAALPLAGLTALRLLRALGSISSRRILLTGASGGVGHYFVELAAAQGASVTVVTRSAERARRLRALGAVDALTDVSEGEGQFDIGLDSVGGDLTGRVLTRLHADGTLVWFGQAGMVPPTLDFFDWSGGTNATIRKFDYSDNPVPDAADLTTLVRLVENGHLHPELGLVENWSAANDAIESLLARQIRGNLVLRVQ